VNALTAVVELGVGVACIALGVTVARTRSAPVFRLLGVLVAIAGAVAAVHAVATTLSWSGAD
jgi:hypothetical protein